MVSLTAERNDLLPVHHLLPGHMKRQPGVNISNRFEKLKDTQAGRERQRWDETRWWALQTPPPGEMESNSYRRAPHLLFSGSNQTAPRLNEKPSPTALTPQLLHAHPTNWNLTTGSRALSLKCRRVIETSECGITVGSGGWLGTDALHYLNASLSISSQTLIWFLWIHTARCALLEAAWRDSGRGDAAISVLVSYKNKK